MSARRALAAAALVAAIPAAAYQRSAPEDSDVCFWWGPRTVHYRLNLSSTRVHATPTCGGDAAVEAVRRGFERWSGGGTGPACTDLSLRLAPEYSTSTLVGVDWRPGQPNESLVVFREGWCSDPALVPADDPCWDATSPIETCTTRYNCFDDSGTLGRNTLALTTVTYDARDGRILDADVEVNAWDGRTGGFLALAPHGWYYTCGAAEPGPACGVAGTPECCRAYGEPGCQYLDLESVVTHEAGHFLGLAHVEDERATMYPTTRAGQVSQRSLDADDVAGLCAIYPAGATATTCGVNEPGGCGQEGTAGAGLAVPLGALLAALALGAARRRGA